MMEMPMSQAWEVLIIFKEASYCVVLNNNKQGN